MTFSREEVAAEILNRFQGRKGVTAIAKGKGFEPYGKELSPADLVRAWDKKHGCGFYVLSEKSTCVCSCIDLDHHGRNETAIQDAAAICKFVAQQTGIEFLLEVSQSGEGAHAWIFHEELPAGLVRDFWQAVLDKNDEKAEIYPRQNSLDGLEKSLGNLVRYPLFGHSKFVTYDLEDRDTLEALRSVSVLTRNDLQQVVDWWAADTLEKESSEIAVVEGLPPRVVKLISQDPGSVLAVRWHGDASGMQDPTNSAMAQAIAVELVRGLVPTHEIEQALYWWSKDRDYAKGMRESWLKRTTMKAYDYATARRVSVKARTMAGAVHRYADDIRNGTDILYGFGIDKLDASIGGFAPGELTVIAARASNGKTAIGLQILDYAASCGLPGELVSLEMSDRENARRKLATLAGDLVAESRTEIGNLKIHQRIDEFFSEKAPILFQDDLYHIDEIEKEMRHVAQEHGVKVVVVDYMGLISSQYQKEYESQTHIVKRLKRLARQLNIAVVVLVQLKRPNDNDNGLRPQMHHLRSSGEIENTADNIIAGVWPWKCVPERFEDKTDYWMFVLKCRNRGINSPQFSVLFDYERQRFQ